ncbi:AAA family ATPase [Virgibacillus sp. L01]|uniref:AAA family ATPase n=1 Tax=Virgibacillus sp. L01 TaxID=3457429 RepID=UPI003FD0086C
MINGAFGVGKTTISNELVKDVEGSMIFDPEEVGFMLRNVIPEDVKQLEAKTGDFQDLLLWKELTVNVAESLITKCKVNLIVPMTIQKPEYLDYIINGFKGIDQQTYHFCLTASKGTIFERLRDWGEEDGNWCFRQTDQCLKSFKENNFEEYIDTENVEVSNIIDIIKDRLSIEVI